MSEFILGAATACSALIGLFFLKFWRKTRDRIFLYFALSFWIEGIARVQEAVIESSHQDEPATYVFRLLAYGLIIWAIVEKNLPRKPT